MNVTNVRLHNEGTVNKNTVTITTSSGDIQLHFSYSTIIGFTLNDGVTRVTAEHFSNTTSKYQNELEPNKKLRTNPEEFQK